MSSTVRQGSDGSAAWCEILFDSGERVFISIEVWPATAIKVTQLVLGGLIPVKTCLETDPCQGRRVLRLCELFQSNVLSQQNKASRATRSY